MTKRIREQHREALLALMEKHELTRLDVACLLPDVSVHTVNAWLKPESSKSSNPVPAWAMELLGYKLKDMKKRRA